MNLMFLLLTATLAVAPDPNEIIPPSVPYENWEIYPAVLESAGLDTVRIPESYETMHTSYEQAEPGVPESIYDTVAHTREQHYQIPRTNSADPFGYDTLVQLLTHLVNAQIAGDDEASASIRASIQLLAPHILPMIDQALTAAMHAVRANANRQARIACSTGVIVTAILSTAITATAFSLGWGVYASQVENNSK